jgi:ABC-type spermidine/putrescine transport system permease subunit I
MRKRWAEIAALLLPGGIIIAVFAAMMVSMFRYSLAPGGANEIGQGFTLEHYIRFLSSSFYWGYLSGSLRISLYCTFITAVVGYVIAYAMYRSGPTVRLVAGAILIIQFFTAYVIRTYAVMLIIGKTGLINTVLLSIKAIDQPIRILFTETGVAIGLVMVSVPFMVFPILASLQRISPNVEMAASSLGAPPFRTFWTVIFPLSLPGVAAGIVIVYLFELTSYIVPGLLGGGYSDMIANFIYNKAMRSFEYSFASAVAVITLILSALIVYALNSVFDRLTRYERAT